MYFSFACAFGSALLFLLPVLIFLVSQSITRGSIRIGEPSCSGLFTGGSYSENQPGSERTWRPDGCVLKLFTREDSVRCIQTIQESKKRPFRIIFAGDSRIRQLRDGMVLQLTGRDSDWLANRNVTFNSTIYRYYGKHESSKMKLDTASGAVMEFIFLNDVERSNFERTIATLRKKTLWVQGQGQEADLLIFGVGAWRIRTCTHKNVSQEWCAQDYKSKIKEMVPSLNKVAQSVPILWAPQNPVKESFMWDREFTNKIMRMYNAAALEALKDSNVTYWNSYYETALAINDSNDGLHLGATTKYFDIQMLLNFLCSPEIKYSSFWTSATPTCCSDIRTFRIVAPEKMSGIWMFALYVCVLLFCLSATVFSKGIK